MQTRFRYVRAADASTDKPTVLRRSKRTQLYENITPYGTSADTPTGVLSFPTSAGPSTQPAKRSKRGKSISHFATPADKPSASPSAPIAMLGPGELLAIFGTVAESAHDGSNVCRTVLPLVCKKWSQLLRRPSETWKMVSTASYAYDVRELERWLHPRAPSIRTLELTEAVSSDATLIDGVRRVVHKVSSRLTTLTIHYMASWDLLKDISRCRALEKLEVMAGPLEFAASHSTPLAALTNLKQLKITTREDDDDAGPSTIKFAKPIVKKLSALECLELGSEAHRPVIVDVGTSITKFKKLKTLRLNNVDCEGDCFDDLHKLSNLTELDLSGSRRLRISEYIKNIPKMAKLLVLKLNRCAIADFSDLDQSDLASVTKLCLSDNRELGPFPNLGGLDSLPDVLELELQRCGLSLLPGDLHYLKFLQTLDVSENHLVNLVMDDVPMLTCLRCLKASKNDFPAIPSCLLEPGPSYLRYVDMGCCPYLEVASSVKSIVSNHPSLEVLRLEKTNSSKDETEYWIQELKEAFAAEGRGDVLRW